MGVLAILFAAGACDKADFKGAEAEVKKIEANLDLPAVPAFDVPTAQGSTHTPRELRLVGQKYLNTDVEVKGFITYRYNCMTDGKDGVPPGGPDTDDKTRAKLIEESPEKVCNKPWMVLNDTADGNPRIGLTIVFDEFQYLLHKRVQKRNNKLTKEEEAAVKVVDDYKAGDEITVSGKFVQSSPEGFGDSHGLLVLKNPLVGPGGAPTAGGGDLFNRPGG
ncbi:MAG TPA: hypothetical protein VL172_14930 [Kofleriaceae bacterium]|nr:hypothetical protein [Kofleriaceae bacterium]